MSKEMDNAGILFHINICKKEIEYMKEFSPPLDKGIERAVLILNAAGIETYESCEGGEGHAYPEPTVRFHGERSEGFRALAVAMENGLNPAELKRVWVIIDGEPTGPEWEITF